MQFHKEKEKGKKKYLALFVRVYIAIFIYCVLLRDLMAGFGLYSVYGFFSPPRFFIVGNFFLPLSNRHALEICQLLCSPVRHQHRQCAGGRLHRPLALHQQVLVLTLPVTFLFHIERKEAVTTIDIPYGFIFWKDTIFAIIQGCERS